MSLIGATLLAALADMPAYDGGITLGSGNRPAKGPPPKATDKRAKIKAARKANVRRKK